MIEFCAGVHLNKRLFGMNLTDILGNTPENLHAYRRSAAKLAGVFMVHNS